MLSKKISIPRRGSAMGRNNDKDKAFCDRFAREWNEACNMIKLHNEKVKCAETQKVIRTSSGYSRRYKDV